MSEEQDLQSSSPSEVDSSYDEESKAGTSVAVNPFFDKNKRTLFHTLIAPWSWLITFPHLCPPSPPSGHS